MEAATGGNDGGAGGSSGGGGGGGGGSGGDGGKGDGGDDDRILTLSEVGHSPWAFMHPLARVARWKPDPSGAIGPFLAVYMLRILTCHGRLLARAQYAAAPNTAPHSSHGHSTTQHHTAPHSSHGQTPVPALTRGMPPFCIVVPPVT